MRRGARVGGTPLVSGDDMTARGRASRAGATGSASLPDAEDSRRHPRLRA